MVGELHTHLSMCQAVIWSLREEIFEGRLPVLEIAAFLVVFGDLLVRPVVRREADISRQARWASSYLPISLYRRARAARIAGDLSALALPIGDVGLGYLPVSLNQGGLGVRTVRAKLQEPLSVGTPGDAVGILDNRAQVVRRCNRDVEQRSSRPRAFGRVVIERSL